MAFLPIVTLEEIRAAGRQPWHLDSTALKSIRYQGENPAGTPIDWSGLDLTNRDPYPVLTVHRDTGPAFTMGEPQQPWSWRKMLNRFDDCTLRRIIGPGVVAIFCEPIGHKDACGLKHPVTTTSGSILQGMAVYVLRKRLLSPCGMS